MIKNQKRTLKLVLSCILIVMILIIIIIGICSSSHKNKINQSKILLESYMRSINEENYEAMYESLNDSSKEKISKEDFINRNSRIYNGIDLQEIKVTIENVTEKSSNEFELNYINELTTSYGTIRFENKSTVYKIGKEYKMEWSSNLIFPNLNDTDKIKVNTLTAKRGNIYDRNDNLLAGEGTIYSIGFVPGKMNEDAIQDKEKIASLLDMTVEKIDQLLSASYVKEDTFVELKKVSLSENELIDRVLEVKGIKVIEKSSRVYPYGESTSHLIGYIQNINAEELDKHKGDGYHSNSVIGKSGLERSYEERLRGIDGVQIVITDSDGDVKETILKKDVKNGEDIKLTIDAVKQNEIYNRFKTQRGFFIIMNPKTGEVLTLVSTPSFDSNDFANGISTSKWNDLNHDESKPLYARYLSSWCPGSTFKPITASIGLNTGKIDPNEDFGHSGYSYQKDESWGNYQITTLQEYFTPAILQNALKYSDNIYFAKAGMKIGGQTLAEELTKIGFNESVDFDLLLTASSFSNTNEFETEIKLADSSYGQGEILVNPIHMASIYSCFVNGGNMILPYIEYREDKTPQFYKENVFSQETANIIKEDLIQVVEGYDATAHRLKTEGITIGAKTGTAELKSDKESEGIELSWLDAFTADDNTDRQYLVICMREDDKKESFSIFPLVKWVFE